MRDFEKLLKNKLRCLKCGSEMSLFPVYPDKAFLKAVEKGQKPYPEPYPEDKDYWLCLNCQYRRFLKDED